MRKAKVHCKNCKYFLKNKESRKRIQVNEINPLMASLIASGKEIKYDGVCIKNSKGVYIENKCNNWKYKSKEKNIRYTGNINLDNYECDNQLNIKDIGEER